MPVEALVLDRDDRVAQRGAGSRSSGRRCAGSPRRGTCGSACRRPRRSSTTPPRSASAAGRPGRVGAADGREADGEQRRARGGGSAREGSDMRACPFSHPAVPTGPNRLAARTMAPVTDLLADLDAARPGPRHHRPGRARGPAGRGPDHALLRLRPHRRQPPRRQPDRPGRCCAGSRTPATGPIALAGGATGMVGDPGGPLRGAQPARRRRPGRQRRRHQGADGRGSSTWTPRGPTSSTTGTGPKDLTLLEFLRDVGKHATVNQMLARESVRARLEREHGISFTEFSYMLLQANDYLWLHEHAGLRAPDRRLGPVGQHPLGRRPDPPGRGPRPCTPCPGRS